MSGISPRETVRAVFENRSVPKPPFIPWISSFAAGLEQVSTEEMLGDPGVLSNSLLNCQRLFGYDAIAVVLDDTLEAEACGCDVEWSDAGGKPRVVSHALEARDTVVDLPDLVKRGRIPLVAEACRRIIKLAGKQVAVLGVVTGPMRLMEHLFGEGCAGGLAEGSGRALSALETSTRVCVQVARQFGEMGVDGIVLADRSIGSADRRLYPALGASLKSISNVIHFYGIRSLLLTTGTRAENAGYIAGLPTDGVSLGLNIDFANLRKVVQGRFMGVGIDPCIMGEAFDFPLDGELVRGVFLTTDWELPPETGVDAMHSLMAVLRR